MPISVTKTKFIWSKRGEGPRYSTEELWAKFTYQIIGAVERKSDKLIELEEKTDNSDDIALSIEVCQGVFLDALGEETSAEIQLKKPKVKNYEQKLGWL